MDQVTVSELRTGISRVVERVAAGERVTITRHGEPVACLVPVDRRRASATELVKRFGRLPIVDPYSLRVDIEGIFRPAT